MIFASTEMTQRKGNRASEFEGGTDSRNLTRTWASVLLFVSSYAPLPFILVVKYWDELAKTSTRVLVACGTIGLVIVAALLLAGIVREQRGGFVVAVTSVQHRSADVVNYTLPYLASFLGFDFLQPSHVAAFALFMALLCLLAVQTETIFLNPLLAAFGFDLYDVEYGENDVTKRGLFISRLTLRPRRTYTIQRLARYASIVTAHVPS